MSVEPGKTVLQQDSVGGADLTAGHYPGSPRCWKESPSLLIITMTFLGHPWNSVLAKTSHHKQNFIAICSCSTLQCHPKIATLYQDQSLYYCTATICQDKSIGCVKKCLHSD